MAAQSYAQGIQSGRNGAVSAARTASKQVADHFSSANGDAWWAGYNMASGMAQGISAGQSLAVSAAARMAAASVAAAKSTLNEASPSKVLREVGRYYTQGYALGIEDEAGKAEGAAGGMAGRSVEAAASGIRSQLGALRTAVAGAASAFGDGRSDQLKAARYAAVPAAPQAPQASIGGADVAAEVREVRAEIEALRKSLERADDEGETYVRVANARELARELSRCL